MNKDEFLRALELNGTLVPKRCNIEYLQKHGLVETLNQLCPEEFGTISDRIKYVKYGGGYCEVCGTRTEVSASGKGFANYCKLHFHSPKKGKVAHNKKSIDIDRLKHLYVNENMSMVALAKEFNVSNVTVAKALKSANVEIRTHSENQKLHSSKEKWSEEKKSDFRNKVRETSLRKYGTEHHTQTEEYLIKRSRTNLEKYGTENPLLTSVNRNPFFQTEEGKRWIKDNNRGAEYLKKSREKRLLEKVTDSEFAMALINKENEVLIKKIREAADICQSNSRVSISKQLGISNSYLNFIMRKIGMSDEYVTKFQSNGENEIAEFLSSLNLSFIRNDRKILKGYELDLLIPNKNLAIEFNGLIWHSEGQSGKDRKYHLSKTNGCENEGIQLLHILDVEWEDDIKKDIWKSIILSKCNLLPNRVYARNCEVKPLSSSESRVFFENNHLEGFVGGKEHYGLFHYGELVSAIIFGKSRFSDEDEVIRFANKKYHSVVGGYSKLLRKYSGCNLVSFANRRYSSILKPNQHFSQMELTDPNWWGYNIKDYEIKHRSSFTKSKVKKLFDYDESLTIIENMFRNGYDRIWDCGSIKYISKK